MTSRQDTRSKARFGSDQARGALETVRRSSTRRQGRKFLSRRCMSSERATGLDVARGSLETGGTFVKGTVHAYVSELPALKAGLVVSGVVMGEGSVIVTASPPNFDAFKSSFFFFGQGR